MLTISEQGGFEPWRQITANRARAVRFDLDVREDVIGEEYCATKVSLERAVHKRVSNITSS